MLNRLTINALQNLLFCVPKAAVLHGKSVGFATQKSHFRNAKAQFLPAQPAFLCRTYVNNRWFPLKNENHLIYFYPSIFCLFGHLCL
ncbi:hypothetical protein CLI70_08775 [Prevotella intermedia]|nr:hypothetical protein CLI70_08775 [Prevotella intermedia]